MTGTRRIRAAALGLVLGATMLAGCTTTTGGTGRAASAAVSPGAPGAPGIGDPYFPLDGNGGYDVAGYALDVTYVPATDLLTGTAELTALATQELAAFNLDLVGLEVRSVTVDGAPAAWTRDAGELTVTPPTVLAAQREFTTVITYDGVPAAIGDPIGTEGFIHTDDGALVVGQPDSAATWFPVNDHPLDPATYTIRITVPDGLEAMSNGVLVGTTSAAGTTTSTWRSDEPMASYLVGMAIGEFDVRAYEAAGIRYWDALDPGLGAAGAVAAASLGRQPEVIAFLEGYFGPYPFGAAGGIVDDVPELGFALETQTRPIYAPSFFSDAVSGDVVVVHELAHQWFGDSLLIAGWRDIWLNEGFATYAEWLWNEREGRLSVQEQFDRIATIPADSGFWMLRIGEPGPDRIFDPAVYLRGGMTVQALRTEVGDDAFLRILTEWTGRRAGENVTTEEFVALAEEVSGQDLAALFETWLMTPEKPDLP